MQSRVVDHAEMIRCDYVFNINSRETKVYTCIIMLVIVDTTAAPALYVVGQ